MPTDSERLDWLEKHSLRNRPEDAADIRIEADGDNDGFFLREWGEVAYDDEGHPDWRSRFYRATRHATLREAIDAAIAAAAPRAVEECGATHRPADGNDARDHD